jgi:gamma-glutamylcysteine synthetase
LEQSAIDNAIYEKYIAPTKSKTGHFIGIEIEMPVVNLNKEPVDENVIFKMSAAFCAHFGFHVIGRDTDGNANSMQDDVTGDNLSFDCCYSNLELSLGKGVHLHQIYERFDKYYKFINNFLSDYNYTLTGMGINPYYNINHNQPIQNERYRMLYHHLHSYKKYESSGFPFHNFPSFGTFTSASQVQLDIDHEDLITVINTFGKLEPFKSLLFSNSLLPDEPDLLCVRNMLWERSMHGYNPHNIGMFEYELKDSDDLLEYIKSTSIYCTMRNGKYINFKPIPINQYMKLDKVSGEYFDGSDYRNIEFEPCEEDLEYLRTFKFEDLTYRGTIEFRSMCCQPISDCMSVAAFHIGLLERLPELQELLNSDKVIYSHGYTASELQRLFSLKELPSFVDKEMLSDTLLRILNLSEDGLKQRGMNEEVFLEPLFERARTLSNPAKKMLNGMENGVPLEYYIKEYS